MQFLKTITLNFITLSFLFVMTHLVCQNKDSKWVVGASIGIVKFASEDSKFIGDHFIFQIPRLNVSRYFPNGVTVDASFSFNGIDKITGVFTNSVDYLSIDLGARCDFGKTNKNLVPYLFAGTSFITVKRAIIPF